MEGKHHWFHDYEPWSLGAFLVIQAPPYPTPLHEMFSGMLHTHTQTAMLHDASSPHPPLPTGEDQVLHKHRFGGIV